MIINNSVILYLRFKGDAVYEAEGLIKLLLYAVDHEVKVESVG